MRERSTSRQHCTIVPPWADETAYLRVIAGPLQGLELELSSNSPLVIGRGSDADLWIPDSAVSRRHCQVQLIGRELEVCDMGSKNGLHLNGEPIRSGRITENDRLHIAGDTMLRLVFVSAAESERQEQLVFAATRDALTRAYNRGYFDERIEAELSFAHRHGTSLSLLTLDLDGLKQVNDGLGHAAGDVALTRFADRVRSLIRKEDLFARIGGDEFALIVRGIDERQAREFATRLCCSLDGGTVTYDGHAVPISASIGVATTPPATVSSGADLLRIADVALYRAKRDRRARRGDARNENRGRSTLPLALCSNG